MKKILSMILITIIILSVFTVNADSIKLTDIEKHWAKSNIEQLISMGIVDGYLDGTFKPDDTLKFEEFIKMLVTATEKEEIKLAEGEKWYKPYIDIALENNYIIKDMKKLIGTNVDRKTMAEIIYNLIASTDGMIKLNEKEIRFVADKFSDLKATDEKVLHIASMGIINGYPDNTYKPNNNLKRSEATTVILRILDESKRTPMEIILPKELSDFPEPDLDYLREYPCDTINGKTYTVSERHEFMYRGWKNPASTDITIDLATNLMNMVANIDYRDISIDSIKKPFIYYLHNSVEYRGISYSHLIDGDHSISNNDTYLDNFYKNYLEDIKDNKIKIQGKYYTSEDLCISHYGSPASRGILRFKIESASDLDLVKQILFVRDTEREKRDNIFNEIDYGSGIYDSMYIKNSDIDLKLDTWYEVGIDIAMSRVARAMSINVYKNYETCDYAFDYICPIYIKELK